MYLKLKTIKYTFFKIEKLNFKENIKIKLHIKC